MCFLRRGVVSTSPNPQAGGPPLVGCPRLLILFIHSYPPYRRPFLHPQPEDAPCLGDRDPHSWRLEDYWTKMEELLTPFYGQTMARARYYHILRFLHFTDNNRNGVDRTEDRLWKIRDLFEIIRTNFLKFYIPSEHLAVDEIIVKFKGRMVFKQYIPKNANVLTSKCSNYVTLQDIHIT